MKPFCTECATPGLQMFPHRNYPRGSKIDPFSETLPEQFLSGLFQGDSPDMRGELGQHYTSSHRPKEDNVATRERDP